MLVFTDTNLLEHKTVFTIDVLLMNVKAYLLPEPLHHIMCHQSIISHNNGQAEHTICQWEMLNIEKKSAYTAEQFTLTAQGESLAYLRAIAFAKMNNLMWNILVGYIQYESF